MAEERRGALGMDRSGRWLTGSGAEMAGAARDDELDASSPASTCGRERGSEEGEKKGGEVGAHQI